MNPLTLLTGYRTIIAGIGLIGLGAYEMSEGKTDDGATHIAAGLAAIGIGGKLDKMVEATREPRAVAVIETPPG